MKIPSSLSGYYDCVLSVEEWVHEQRTNHAKQYIADKYPHENWTENLLFVVNLSDWEPEDIQFVKEVFAGMRDNEIDKKYPEF